MMCSPRLTEIEDGVLPMSAFQNHDMVQTLPSNRANQPLGKGILPRTSRCRHHLLHPQRLDPTPKLVAVAGVTVADQIPWSLPPGWNFRACGQVLSLAGNESFFNTHSDAQRLWYKEKSY